jgi:cytoskeletal protein RodZ
MPDNLARVATEQPLTLQEIGSNLRQLRQNNSLSIEEIADRTRIQPRLIRALEDGQVEILPEPIYIHGMVKKYGESLGVNGLEIAKTLPTQSADVVLAQDSRWAGFRRPQLRPIHLYLGYIFLLLAAISALSNVLNTAARNLPTPTQQQLPAVTNDTPQASPPPANSPKISQPQI